jgi:predicted enzyme related to lactoylglutathione lyase
MSKLEIRGIDNVLHAVGDLEEAKRFYGARLGLTLKFEVAAAGIALYRIGDAEPGLLIRRQEPAPPRVWLEVADAREAARQFGGEAREINTGWLVEIADPCGNIIGLTDYAKRPHASST